MTRTLDASSAPLPTHGLGLPLLALIRRDPLGAATRFREALGDVATLHVLFRRITYLFDPEAARALLVEHHDALRKEERLLAMFATFQGRNVLTTEGEAWERQRRIVAPGFSARKLAGYMALMCDAIDACVGSGLPGAPGASAEVDVDALSTRITMDVILRTLFSQPPSDADAAAASTAVRGLSAQTMRESFWPVVPRAWMPFPGRTAKRRHLATIDALIGRHVEARLAREATACEADDILAMLLAARDDQPGAQHAGLDLEEIRANCLLLFGAGFDTAASALTWWLGLMATHPDALARVRAELDAAGRDAPLEAIARLPWLNATLKEAMRLYPPSTALITRVLQRDLRLGDALLPAGTLAIVPIWHLHHDARSFPEPDAFRPERFMPGAPAFPRGAYLPFGAGPHVCLGQHFAAIEMALVAARLAGAYDLQLVGDALPEPVVDLALKPKRPLRVRFTRRAGGAAAAPAGR